MGLFTKSKSEAERWGEPVILDHEHAQELVVFYRHTIRVLLSFIKAFSLDLSEIDADGFKARMDELDRYFEAYDKQAKLYRIFSRYKEIILHYIEREKAYLRDREDELKGIIEFLTSSIAALVDDNEEFQRQLYRHSTQLERLVYLDDIRRIKAEIQHEVAQVKHHLREKQTRDAQRLETLSRQLQDLRIGFEKAKNEAMTDGLTGAYNRAAFDKYVARLVERHRLTPTPFALLLLDVDDFKRLNDTCGHRVGDRILATLVQKCRMLIRQEDFLARYGGEEFAIILLGTSLRHAVKRARAICKAIARAWYIIDEQAPTQRVTFTVSIGVSTIHQDDTVETLIERADKALYQAKRLGKNRVVSEKEVEAL